MSVFDIDALKRFCDGVQINQDKEYNDLIQHQVLLGKPGTPPRRNLADDIDHDDIAHVAFALSCLVYGGTDLKKELGIVKKRGRKKSKFSKTIHGAEMALVTSFVGGELTYMETLKFFIDEFEVDRTTAEEYIKDKRGVAKKLIESFYKGGAPKELKPYQTRDIFFQNNF